MERAGISLRKKRSVRPKISAPQQISAPVSSTLPLPFDEGPQRPRRPRLDAVPSSSSISPSREKSQGRENTADYVKRRYSTRITQLPKNFDAPAVPALPSQYSQSLSQPPTRNGHPTGNEKVEIDLKALEDPHLRPEQYVAQLLANASEQDIRDYQHDLGRIKNRTSHDIQYNLTANRNHFIKISQEAEKLKTEMRALRNLMSDLTNTLGQTNAALGISSDTISSRKYANRSSVANLEAMWNSHLQELWRRVEGAQKYLPAIPGRHVIHESGRWVELNIATWKPRRRVHIILLNDHLLVALEKNRVDHSSPVSDTRKPKPSQTQAQLIADRCWPLQDIEITDLSTKPGARSEGPRGSQTPTSNAINVRIGSDSFTYATTDKQGTEKSSLLAKCRKSLADLRKASDLDAEEHPVIRDAQRSRSHREKEPTGNVDIGNGVDLTMKKASMLVEVDGKQQDFRWVENQVDELDIDIALQRFDAAVTRVDLLRRIAKSNKANPSIQDLADGKLQDRAAKLARAVTRQMGDASSFLALTQQHVAWLSKLGFETSASEAYLDARSNVIQVRTSQCADQGDLHQYLYQISFIFFTLIRNAVSIYQACFPPAMASACVKWAKQHVDDYNIILSQQLGKLDVASEERRYCLETSREHAALLSDVGIDFRNLVGKGL